jgi:hypothetical protein
MLGRVDCWILWRLEDMTILWNLRVYRCFCGINWAHLQGIHLQNGPILKRKALCSIETLVYLGTHTSLFQNKSQQFYDFWDLHNSFFHQSPIFFGDLLPNQVPHNLYCTQTFVSRISHVHKQATLVTWRSSVTEVGTVCDITSWKSVEQLKSYLVWRVGGKGQGEHTDVTILQERRV